MGHIREPKGVDFIIKSEPLTESARNGISKFIREYRNKSALNRFKYSGKHHKSVILCIFHSLYSVKSFNP